MCGGILVLFSYRVNQRFFYPKNTFSILHLLKPDLQKEVLFPPYRNEEVYVNVAIMWVLCVLVYFIFKEFKKKTLVETNHTHNAAQHESFPLSVKRASPVECLAVGFRQLELVFKM